MLRRVYEAVVDEKKGSPYKHGVWTAVAARIPGRNAKQCRNRYTEYAAPHLSPRPWTEAQEHMLLLLADEFRDDRTRWKKIADSPVMAGRSPGVCKNRYHILTRKRTLSPKQEFVSF